MTEKIVKVLVVEDEKVVRDFLTRLLKLRNIQTQEAEDGFAAIEAAKKEDFDLALIDMRMPKMNGLETLRELKKIRPALKYVMMTGYALEDLLDEAQKEGAMAALRKPFDINEMLNIIKTVQSKDPQKTISILIVDDDDAILTFFKNLLKEKIYDLSTAKTGQEALEQLQQKKIDLVLLDIALKDTTGIELYQKIREAKPDLDVVLMTGYPEKAKDISRLEIVGCLYKPFEIDKIMSEIEKIRK